MKTYIRFAAFAFVFLLYGCATDAELVHENNSADSADLNPPGEDLLQTAPVIRHQEEAYFPEMAQKTNAEGNVVLRAWITKTGAVRKVHIHRSENELFNKSALTAGLKYTFEPMIKDGKAVDSWVEFTIQYRRTE